MNEVTTRSEQETIAELKNLGATVSQDDRGEVRGVYFFHCHLTDDLVPHLAGFGKLERLNFSNTQITDDGLAQFQGRTSLKTLILAGAPISDVAVDILCGLTALESLNVRRTQISEGGVERLKQALPRCEILW